MRGVPCAPAQKAAKAGSGDRGGTERAPSLRPAPAARGPHRRNNGRHDTVRSPFSPLALHLRAGVYSRPGRGQQAIKLAAHTHAVAVVTPLLRARVARHGRQDWGRRGCWCVARQRRGRWRTSPRSSNQSFRLVVRLAARLRA